MSCCLLPVFFTRHARTSQLVPVSNMRKKKRLLLLFLAGSALLALLYLLTSDSELWNTVLLLDTQVSLSLVSAAVSYILVH